MTIQQFHTCIINWLINLSEKKNRIDRSVWTNASGSYGANNNYLSLLSLFFITFFLRSANRCQHARTNRARSSSLSSDSRAISMVIDIRAPMNHRPSISGLTTRHYLQRSSPRHWHTDWHTALISNHWNGAHLLATLVFAHSTFAIKFVRLTLSTVLCCYGLQTVKSSNLSNFW